MCEQYSKLYRKVMQECGAIAGVLYGEIENRHNYFKANGMLTQDGYCYLTISMLEDATGIKRDTQIKYIKTLIEHEYLLVKTAGMPRKRYFKPTNKITQVVENLDNKQSEKSTTSSRKSRQQEVENTVNNSRKSRQQVVGNTAINKNKEKEQIKENKEEEQIYRTENEKGAGAGVGDAKPKRKRSKFIPPTLEEVKAYAFERHSNVDPFHFWEYYSTGEWMDAKGNPVKNWKQKFITWEKRNNTYSKPKEDSRLDMVNRVIAKYERGEGSDIFG